MQQRELAAPHQQQPEERALRHPEQCAEHPVKQFFAFAQFAHEFKQREKHSGEALLGHKRVESAGGERGPGGSEELYAQLD